MMAPERYVILVWWFDNWAVGSVADTADEAHRKATQSGLAMFRTVIVDTEGAALVES